MHKAIITGRLTRDPERKTCHDGAAMAVFSIASDEYAKGEKKCMFFDCSAFGKTGEFILAHFTKGKPILVDGKLQTYEYTNQAGARVEKMRVVVHDVEFFESAKRGEIAQSGGVGGVTFGDVGDEDIPF